MDSSLGNCRLLELLVRTSPLLKLNHLRRVHCLIFAYLRNSSAVKTLMQDFSLVSIVAGDRVVGRCWLPTRNVSELLDRVSFQSLKIAGCKVLTVNAD